MKVLEVKHTAAKYTVPMIQTWYTGEDKAQGSKESATHTYWCYRTYVLTQYHNSQSQSQDSFAIGIDNWQLLGAFSHLLSRSVHQWHIKNPVSFLYGSNGWLVDFIYEPKGQS